MQKLEWFRILGPRLPDCKLGPIRQPVSWDQAECMTEGLGVAGTQGRSLEGSLGESAQSS